MSWLKKGNFIAAGTALLVISAFGVLFLDGLIRRALVSAGQAAAGAKVEIGSVRTRLLAGRATVSRARAADKDEPMKNLVEFELAEFALKPSALLRGKVVVTAASLTGLRFGTARQTSGALAPRPPSALEAAVRRQLAPAASPLGEAKRDVKTELDAAKLQSLKALEEARARLEAVPGRFQAKAEEAGRIEAELREITKTLSGLKGGGSPADIARSVETAASAQRRLKALLADVERSKKELARELDAVKARLKQAEELKGRDLSGLMAAAGLPSLDAAELSRRLLGPALMKKVSTGMRWLAWAKNSRPARQAAKKPERRRGLTIEFPSKDGDPSFLLEHARLQGFLAREAGELALEGSLGGVTTNPPLYGKPARLRLSGGGAVNGPSFKLDGTLDQTKEPGAGTLEFSYAGVPLSGLMLGDEELGAKLAAGSARVSGSLKLAGEEWSGEVRLQAEGVSLEPKLGMKGGLGRLAGEALRGVKGFGAVIGLSGREDDLSFTVRSDLGTSLAEGLKRGAASAFAAQRKALEDKVNALYAGKAAEVRGRLGGVEASLLGPLQKQEGAIQDALKQAAARALGPKLDLKKLFR